MRKRQPFWLSFREWTTKPIAVRRTGRGLLLYEVLDLEELVAIEGPCVDFEQDVVVLFMYFAEIEGEDF